MIPAWVSVLVALLAPLAFSAFGFGVAPSGKPRSYRSLLLLSLLISIIGISLEFFLGTLIEKVSGAGLQPAISGFVVGAIPEEGAKLSAFLLWLAFLRDRGPRDAIVSAVIAAMVFDAVGNVLIFPQASDVETWVQTVAIRSLLTTAFSAASAFVAGIWTAAVIADSGRKAIHRIGGACLAAIIADGLWGTGGRLGSIHWDSPDFLSWIVGAMLPLTIASAVIQCAAIVVGIKQLRRFGISMWWPPLLRRQ